MATIIVFSFVLALMLELIAMKEEKVRNNEEAAR